MGRLIRRDDEIDNGSPSGAVYEGWRAVAVDDIVGEESPAGRRSGGRWRSVGFRGFWRPRCTNGEKGVREEGGKHVFRARLSQMRGNLQT